MKFANTFVRGDPTIGIGNKLGPTLIGLSLDRKLTVLTSFLSYFVMSAIMSPLGIVSSSLSAYYGVSITSATATFSYLTSGLLIGSLCSIVLNPKLGSRNITLISTVTVLAALLSLRYFDSITMLPFVFMAIGVCCGLLLASAAIVLTALYEERYRPSALLATDSFYSFAGFTAPPLAGWVVAQSLHWTYAYGVAFCVLLIIATIALFADYPTEVKAPSRGNSFSFCWPVSTYLVGAALFLYLISFTCIYAWVPVHATKEFGLSASASSLLVSRFFLCLFFGQIALFFLALRVNIRVLIAIVGAGTVLATVGLWASDTASQLELSIAVLGLAMGGWLKATIGYGTQVVDHPTSRLVGFYIFCTALGSSISPAFTAFIVEQTTIKTILYVSTVGFAVTYSLILLSFVASRARTQVLPWR